MKKKTSWLKVFTIVTAVAGAIVAVCAYLKSKSKRLSEELDFDNSLYFDEDNSMMDEEGSGEGLPEYQDHSYSEDGMEDSDVDVDLSEDDEETI